MRYGRLVWCACAHCCRYSNHQRPYVKYTSWPQGAYTAVPALSELSSFSALSAIIYDHVVMAPNKRGKNPENSPAFSPCEFGDKIDPKHQRQSRLISNVVAVHFVCMDIDKVESSKLTAVLDAFNGAETWLYSTFNHGNPEKPGASLRMLVALTRPVAVATEWQYYTAAIVHLSGGIVDSKTLDPTRLFYLPSVRAENKAKRIRIYNPGQPLDTDALIQLGRQLVSRQARATSLGLEPDDESITPGHKLTKEDLLSVAATLKKSRSAKLKAIGAIIKTMADGGNSYAKDGEKDDTLLRVAGRIAHYFPEADPGSLKPLVIASIDATNRFLGNGNDADEDADRLCEKLERLQQTELAKLEAKRAESEAVITSRIRTAFRQRGEEREHPYTEDELAGWRTKMGLQHERELDDLWIVQHHSAYYVLFNGAYGRAMPQSQLLTALKHDLAPALENAGVNTHAIDDKGNAYRMKLDDIMDRYGTAAAHASMSLTAKETMYDPDTRTIVEAPCPLRQLTPTFHQHVHNWLYTFGEPATASKVIRWVSYVTELDTPCVALYLDGPPGTGKSLFSKGLSRLWTMQGASPLTKATDRFNDIIMKCPLLVADEYMPKDLMASGTRVLRELQQSTDRTIEIKNIPIVTMHGAIRLVMSSNNKNMLATEETLTEDDEAAVSERFLYIKMPPAANAYLATLGAAVKDIVDKDQLAEHALYLRDHRKELGIPEPEGRFMIVNGKDGKDTLADSITNNSGIRGKIIHWLLSYLMNPAKYDKAFPDRKIFIHNGELWVKASAIFEHWDAYPTAMKQPALTMVMRSLGGLADKRTSTTATGNKGNYRVIKKPNLIAWAEDTDFMTADEIELALSKPTLERAAGKVVSIK